MKKKPLSREQAAAKKLNDSHAATGGGFYCDFPNGCWRCWQARVNAEGKLEVLPIGENEWLSLDPETVKVRDGYGSKQIFI